jgi:hypothetical protein
MRRPSSSSGSPGRSATRRTLPASSPIVVREPGDGGEGAVLPRAPAAKAACAPKLSRLQSYDVLDVCSAGDAAEVHDEAGAFEDRVVVDRGVGGDDQDEVCVL